MEKAKGSYWHDYNWKFLGIDKKNAEVFKKSREQPNTHNLGERIADAGAHLEEKHTNRDINPAKLKKLRSGKPASYSVDKRYSSEEELDFADPGFQRQMNEMYLLDMLAGYQDRHAGNFMVNREDGKTSVKALDNDLTFGTNTKDFGKRVSHNGGTPEQMQIDKKMAEKIRGMKKETLETALGHLLKQEEIDALWERFGKMNALIDTMEKNHLLVNEWNEDTAAKEFSLASGFSNGTAAGQGNSYYQKLLLMLNAHQQNFSFLPGFL